VSQLEHDEQDLTRKQRREQARAQRRALEEAEAAQAVRRRRLTQLGVVAAIVVIAIVVIAIAAGGGSGSKAPPKKGSSGESTARSAVSTELAGIPQSGNGLGAPNAPVTLVYFGDLQCPFCGEFTTSGALPQVIKKWVRPGKLRIEYRSLETATRDPEVFRLQQIAAMAAGKQNKQWNYIELFYHEQGKENSGYVDESFLTRLAEQTPGLNLSKWQSDRSSGELASQVVSDQQVATNEGFNGTPSFLLGTTGGALKKFEPSSLSEAGPFDQAIEALLKG
jgi:protein-disulfide isomerase